MFARLEFVDDEYIHQVCNDFGKITIDDTEYIIENEIEAEQQETEKLFTVLSIDIGIRHLALVLSTADEEYNFINIVGADMVDITTFLHHDVENCQLYHQKTFADWMAHVFDYYKIVFEKVDKILVERQPPMGLVAVEQIIFYRYREKTTLISPNSMHKYFNIGHLDYDHRKKMVEKICVHNLRLPSVIEEYNSFARKHDIADAFCIAKFWLDKKHAEIMAEKEQYRKRNIQLTFRGSQLTMDQWFEQFRYNQKK